MATNPNSNPNPNLNLNPNPGVRIAGVVGAAVGQGLPGGPNPSPMVLNPTVGVSNPGPMPSHSLTMPANSHLQAQAQAQVAQLQMQHSQAQAAAQLQAATPPPGATPGSANAKRGQQKPPARPAGALQNPTASPFKTAEVTPAARRKKRKVPEKQVPDRVAALLPESALYTQLLEFEARVDSALARKKIDIQEALKNPPSLQRTLRIYVFNTFANQNKSLQQQNMDPPSWTLRIIGSLEDGMEVDASGMPKQNSSTPPKFSSFFKRITVTLDPNLYPENHTIVWDNARSPAPVEGLEIKRKGDKEFTASIRLEMNYVPEKFKLSPPLTELLGIEVDTRPRIIAALWQYVKAKKLQHPNDPSVINCDPPLQKVFGGEKIKFSYISQKLSQHLSPPQPIHLEHKLKLSGSSPVGDACYDVLVDVPIPLQKEMQAFLANIEKHKDIDACDEAICAAIKKIHEHRRRRAFYLGFSQSPVEFINALIASQSRDLKLVAGEGSRNAEKEGKSDFYNQPWVEDAVIRYLNRKPTAGNEAPGNT
uniref:TSA: Wollemia nobilis Ref_Wollemi_Transcript_5488_2150 transcribed RNA sequence n=1 Tax=Wollemia nobilis TaxID=56998 RepID=A0A0C9SA00_9CONI